MSRKITVALADDHHVVRQGLRALLETEPDLSVVEEAADGSAALEMVTRMTPDVLVLDLAMQGTTGLDVLGQVTRQQPTTRVVVLSMHSGEAYVVEALRRGASAYVLKDATASDLIHAIREVMAGRHYLSPSLSERAIEAYAKTEAAADEPHRVLTPRELEVFRLAARGDSLQQIATELSISPRTAESHRANLMRKLGLHSQTDIVRHAIRHGILPLQ
jgi:DNA-binding NarL/FixJ family response regulator